MTRFAALLLIALVLAGCASQPHACHDGSVVLLPDGGITVCGGLS